MTRQHGIGKQHQRKSTWRAARNGARGATRAVRKSPGVTWRASRSTKTQTLRACVAHKAASLGVLCYLA